MSCNLQNEQHSNFILVGLGFVTEGDSYIVKKSVWSQFVTHPRASIANANCDVFASHVFASDVLTSLTFRIGLKYISKFFKHLYLLKVQQETRSYIHQRLQNHFLFC
jgi:hypothetical protein